jgi:hypothetical protein
MSMPTTHESPDQKAKSRQDEDDPDDMPLLCIDLTLKLKANEGNNPSKHQGSNDVPCRGHGTHACSPQQAPALRACNDRKRNPVIRQDGVQDGNHSGGT